MKMNMYVQQTIMLASSAVSRTEPPRVSRVYNSNHTSSYLPPTALATSRDTSSGPLESSTCHIRQMLAPTEGHTKQSSNLTKSGTHILVSMLSARLERMLRICRCPPPNTQTHTYIYTRRKTSQMIPLQAGKYMRLSQIPTKPPATSASVICIY